ncbi:HalOD1 output domain-containing protein [Natronobacterium gregoryi]|uniref:Halobacterial output domain-containing protein n=2 Tax=Natronobacterium gregoryi TaxID=44930 RepID=L0AFV3_NATGS|nr:HalOD1 output domain-containing protein [Natronobacterium gregoryi]AFZ72686.1 hypothetical protein Natgr_1477 [Natronobacterium gregoryi SP2]ELY69021.1 hypothetical protein C490_08521 [Natronobacterium gregoryi SP2]PLK20638.1 hypothetical protein CYV19_08535 [Natronobacterium gregoryi SP2]SFI91679.1 hypothetical protein SAMN05443661_10968 [Natronobacterium gregoryi]
MPSDHDARRAADSDPKYVAAFDPVDGDKPSEAIVDAVASVTGKDPLEMTPLYEAIDPDALDALFDQRQAGDETHELWFTYDGFDVGVHSDGEIRLRTATDTTSST